MEILSAQLAPAAFERFAGSGGAALCHLFAMGAAAGVVAIGIATQIGQVSLTRGLAVLPAAHGTALSYLQVVFAFILGAMFFSEIPTTWNVVGALIVVGTTMTVALTRRRD